MSDWQRSIHDPSYSQLQLVQHQLPLVNCCLSSHLLQRRFRAAVVRPQRPEAPRTVSVTELLPEEQHE
ncbi:hypothetical protein Q5P01_021801 [Channa striata]|uniref:Uncharacterized protein n=1 Tax=Channa striata TaxID=64152 RepID=A0AA88LV05_CHASR|nr:hypothetical protein Q5P01_021801 [Channa striata]